MTSIIQNSDFTNFLQSGAILQTSQDEFTLIWGPFVPVSGLEQPYLDEKTTIYKPDFWDFTKSKSGLCLSGSKESRLHRSDLLSLLRQHGSVSLKVQWEQLDESGFREQFHWSFEKFGQNILKKTVPIICQRGETVFQEKHLVSTLHTVIQEAHFGYTYGFWDNKTGYVGHTPELVSSWSAETQTFKTVALAGTKEKKIQAESILQDPKILNEHSIVAVDLQEVLSKELPAMKIEIQGPTVLELKYLTHLMTSLQIQKVTKAQALKLLHSLHPSAALGIYPRLSQQYESFKMFELQKKRSGFAAPFGFINKKSMLVVAAIRGFFFTATSVVIFSGCGVTEESDLLEELSEVEKKRNSVKKMMGMNL